MSRSIDRVIEYIEQLDRSAGFSDAEKRCLVNRLNVEPTQNELDRAQADLDREAETDYMKCKHPLGFLWSERTESYKCSDCKTECPGDCVCGAQYRTWLCGTRGHLRGPELSGPPGPGELY